MCSKKITIPKDVCSREMDIEISDARTVEISIDSQLGRIPSVVSAPILHLPPSPKLSWPPPRLHLALRQPPSFLFSSAVVSLRDSKSLSPSVRRYLGRKGFSHNDALIWRILPRYLFPIPCSFPPRHRARAPGLLPFPASLESSREGSKTAPKLAQ